MPARQANFLEMRQSLVILHLEHANPSRRSVNLLVSLILILNGPTTGEVIVITGPLILDPMMITPVRVIM